MEISRRQFIGAAAAISATAALGPIVRLSRSVAASIPPRYNIISITTDDQDLASLRVMRHLISKPRGSWIEFNNYICNNGICGPSRASFYTGMYSHN